MKIGVGVIVFSVLIVLVQTVATIYAIRLIRRTKYNVIWILCIVGFVALLVERVLQITEMRGTEVDPKLTLAFGLTASFSVSLAVFFARLLIDYIERLNHQRNLLNKRILTAVLRTEEQSRSSFAKELHDGMGPLLSSAKMSLSALSGDNLTTEQRDILRNISFVVDEAIHSDRKSVV